MLGLEVQDGGEGLHHFSSRDIWWTEICVEDDSTKDFCAVIPLARLDAIIKAESLVEGFETKFVQKRHTEDDNSSVHDSHMTKMYSRLVVTFFGIGVLTDQKTIGTSRRLRSEIVYNNGALSHGVHDTSNELRSQFAPNLSDECKAYIESLLAMDVSVDAIIDRHLDDPVFCSMLRKRDSFLTQKDVLNASARVRSIRSRKHVNDATSILKWKKQDEGNFFFFQ
ncbi:hypothetical protein SUGI_0070650 [Cryptomeria japonica]|nr:hypothetical protein SUGI_0070650 [Cryptomeria japonica]